MDKLLFIPNKGVTIDQLDNFRFMVMNDDPASPLINAISDAITRMQFNKTHTEYQSVDVLPPVFVRVLRLIGAGG